MITDSYYTIGRTHQVCQDYARSWYDSVALSDGCGGAWDTDLGSRIMVGTAFKHDLNVFGNKQFIPKNTALPEARVS